MGSVSPYNAYAALTTYFCDKCNPGHQETYEDGSPRDGVEMWPGPGLPPKWVERNGALLCDYCAMGHTRHIPVERRESIYAAKARAFLEGKKEVRRKDLAEALGKTLRGSGCIITMLQKTGILHKSRDGWLAPGPATDEQILSGQQLAVVNYMRGREFVRPADIANDIGIKRRSACGTLAKLRDFGWVRRIRFGVYTLTKKARDHDEQGKTTKGETGQG